MQQITSSNSTWYCKSRSPSILSMSGRDRGNSKCPLRFMRQVDLASKRQSLADSFLLYLIQSSVIKSFSASYHHQLLYSNCVRRLALRQTRLYSAAHYNQSHTMLLSLWMHRPIRDVQMSHRLNTGYLWLNTYFCRILSSETNKVQMCVRICKILNS